MVHRGVDDLGVTDPWTTVAPTVNDSSTISYGLPDGKPKVLVRLMVRNRDFRS